MDSFSDRLFHAAVEQAKEERDRILAERGQLSRPAQIREIKTPIVEEMRKTARDLGVIGSLLDAYQLLYLNHVGDGIDALTDGLIRLGVTSEEFRARLERAAV